MSSTSVTMKAADTTAVPKVKSRNPSIDRARTFLTLVVLLHHADHIIEGWVKLGSRPAGNAVIAGIEQEARCCWAV
jgi:hypothetical protein